MWSGHKRHSKRGDWHVPYEKKHRNIVRREAYLQKVHFCLREDG